MRFLVLALPPVYDIEKHLLVTRLHPQHKFEIRQSILDGLQNQEGA
jgi:hypothetical protein